MIRNYLKIALRNLLKNSLFSFVNVVGLIAGLLFSVLIGSYIWGEWRVNKDLRNAERQLFLASKWKTEGMGMDITTLGPIAKRLKEEYPNLVANYYRWDGITSIVSNGKQLFREGIQLGDSTLLSMYGFELLAGNPTTALDNPFSVVITEAKALKLFGQSNPLGKSLTIQNFAGQQHAFIITGILKELPYNSVTNLLDNQENGLFIPNNTARFFGRDNFESWSNTNVPSYVTLRANAQIGDLVAATKRLVAQNAPEYIKTNLKINPIPLSAYHLQKNNGSVGKMLVALSTIGLFILLMALINFINISIGSSGSRTKEIGVRKAIGGHRSQLIAQFLAESFLLVLFSAFVALLLYSPAKPFFEEIIGREIPRLTALPAVSVLYFLGFVVVLGLLAGLYPAFVLSSLHVIDSLKGRLNSNKEASILRKSLVMVQFATALLVVISASIITQQIHHFFGQNLGYSKEGVVSAQVPRDWSTAGVNKMLAIRDQFKTLPQVKGVSLSYEIPNGNNGGQSQLYPLNGDSTRTVATQALISDENYLNTYEISLLAGTFLSGQRVDSTIVVINETAAQQLGYRNSAEAVGQSLRMLGSSTVYRVAGVTRDFQFGTMERAIQPVVFFDVHFVPFYRFISFKINATNVAASLKAIEKQWTNLIPESPFEYSFMDDTLAGIYKNEIQLKKATYTAGSLAVIISLLGVVGLVALSLQRRMKEIGVRKVLGASPFDITVLFFREFTSIFVAACLVASPLAYYFTNRWLDNYASRITLGPGPFVGAALGLVVITALLIGIQTFKAATTNPIKSLKNE